MAEKGFVLRGGHLALDFANTVGWHAREEQDEYLTSYARVLDWARQVGALTPAHAVGELGYWIAVSAWGRGYATEAAGALCDFAFGALDLHRIQARHLMRNPASGRVMQKLGMQREGILRGAVRKWDRFEDLALYAVLAPEWQAARSTFPSSAV